MKHPWMKFYPSDWRADPALRTCSIAARGLWMEMLCVMHEADPRGSLRVNGQPLGTKEIASLAGIRVRDCEKLLAELEKSGVFSRENDGEIFSRRMKRETEKARKDAENGAKGGNPTLKGGVNPQDNAQKLEARSQKERIEEGARAPDDDSQNLPVESPKGAAGKYAFESGVIRLKEAAFNQWRESFTHLDLRAELLSLTQWAGTQKDWFYAVSGALAKRNREQSVKIERAKSQGPPQSKLRYPDDPFDWRNAIT